MKLELVASWKQMFSVIFLTCESTPASLDWKSFSGGKEYSSAAREMSKATWDTRGESEKAPVQGPATAVDAQMERAIGICSGGAQGLKSS